MAAEKSGLPVPQFHLSNDHKRLLVKRFDILPDGSRYGFEDMCALLGLPTREKFTGSVERVIKAIRDYCPTKLAHASVDQFFGQYLLCNAIRNGDAHLKNFGLIYTGLHDVKLAPVYDMLAMSVYAPQQSVSSDADDGMALNFAGSKRWLTEKAIKQLADRCLISASSKLRWARVIRQSVLETAHEVMEHLDRHPEDDFGAQAGRMLTLWSHGIQCLDKDGVVGQQLIEMANSIESYEGGAMVKRPTPN